jgi:predicted GNAT family N-acyltransferase/predicted GNAT family acetyltransferase
VSLTVRLARPEDMPAVHALRHAVFVVGQGVPADIEQDAHDADADHAVALCHGALVATGRLLRRGSGTAGVGRMAVRAVDRRRGIGARVLTRLEQRAAELGMTTVELHAQIDAYGFYERAGYTAVSDVYVEAGIEHVTMRKSLPDVAVREVRDDDGAALIALIGGCWAEYPGVELHVDAEEPWLRAPAAAYRRWDGRMWVVAHAGDVVACCGVKPADEGAVELKSMYVAARARREGLARWLEALVVEEALRRHARRVVLWSDTRFADAHATYRALGYTQLPGERELGDLSDSREYPFAKELATPR